MKKAIILLSGGIDSTVCAAMMKSEGYTLFGLSFNYGQKHLKELEFANKVATIYCDQSKSILVPRISPKEGNYFPARNTIFLAFALSYAEVLGVNAIIIGVNGDDTFFPDCLPDYIKAYEDMASLATKNGRIEILTPLIRYGKPEIIDIGCQLNVDFLNTLTCYEGDNCGVCSSCNLRRRSFGIVGISDPIIYKI